MFDSPIKRKVVEYDSRTSRGYTMIVCGENCYYLPIEDKTQSMQVGFYYTLKGLFIGPFDSISKVEESKRLNYVYEEMFELV